MLKSVWLFILPVVVTVSVANAGFLIEPIIGYQTGTADSKLLASLGGTERTITTTGASYGLGLGWRFPSKVFVGADYLVAPLETKFSPDFTGAPDKLSATAYYLTLGYQAHPLGKVYLGVGAFSSEDNASTSTKYTGTSLKAGAGYEFYNHIALHAEYILYTLTEFQTGGQTIKSADYYEKFNYTATMIAFRFPFEMK
jgi:hypothetical protein